MLTLEKLEKMQDFTSLFRTTGNRSIQKSQSYKFDLIQCKKQSSATLCLTKIMCLYLALFKTTGHKNMKLSTTDYIPGKSVVKGQ